ACLDVARGAIRHKPIGVSGEIETPGWLATPGPVRVGITAGASTPNNKIGDAVARIFATRGIDPQAIACPPVCGRPRPPPRLLRPRWARPSSARATPRW